MTENYSLGSNQVWTPYGFAGFPLALRHSFLPIPKGRRTITLIQSQPQNKSHSQANGTTLGQDGKNSWCLWVKYFRLLPSQETDIFGE
jgi:hypothetical protein